MDQSVLDAVKRWPDVPVVFGWLSLTARGEWKLHPLGDARLGGPGQGISNTQILGFIGRNYASQEDGAWFFQNGPQRVYVRLDAAPLILRVDPSTQSITTHNGIPIRRISKWYCDETGQLFAQTDAGPGRIDDRDLQHVAEVLSTSDGRSLFDLYASFEETDTVRTASVSVFDPEKKYQALSESAPLHFLNATEVPAALHFIPNPGPDSVTSSPVGRKMSA
jgi:hypothetical protein